MRALHGRHVWRLEVAAACLNLLDELALIGVSKLLKEALLQDVCEDYAHAAVSERGSIACRQTAGDAQTWYSPNFGLRRWRRSTATFSPVGLRKHTAYEVAGASEPTRVA